MLFSFLYFERLNVKLFISFFRCVCPSGTFGKRCKILRRHFYGRTGPSDRNDIEDEGGGSSYNSYAWVSSIPPCSELHISLNILTTQKDSIILYSDFTLFDLEDERTYDTDFSDKIIPPAALPVKTSEKDSINEELNPIDDSLVILDEHGESFNSFNDSNVFIEEDIPPDILQALSLELVNGRPVLNFFYSTNTLKVFINNSDSLADNKWHRIDIIWDLKVSSYYII